jgi:hypothetical protein
MDTNLEHLWESLHDFTLFIAIELDSIDESNLGPRPIAEGFEDFGVLSNLLERKTFNLIWPSTPIDGAHQTCPNETDHVGFGNGGIGLNLLQKADHGICTFVLFCKILQSTDDGLSDPCHSLLLVPFADFGQVFLLEPRFELGGSPLVHWEIVEQLLDTASLETGREMINRLLGKIGSEDQGEDRDGQVVLHEMILGKNLQTGCTGQALGDEQPEHERKLFALGLRPFVCVLKKTGEGLILQRLLKIFVPMYSYL